MACNFSPDPIEIMSGFPDPLMASYPHLYSLLSQFVVGDHIEDYVAPSGGIKRRRTWFLRGGKNGCDVNIKVKIAVDTIKQRKTYLKQLSKWLAEEFCDIPTEFCGFNDVSSLPLEYYPDMGTFTFNVQDTTYNVPTFDLPLLKETSDPKLSAQQQEISIDNHVTISSGTKFKQEPGVKIRYSEYIKTKATADAIKLGPTEASRRWSIPVSTIRNWKKKNMQQFGDVLTSNLPFLPVHCESANGIVPFTPMDTNSYAINNDLSDLHKYAIKNEVSDLHTYAIKNEVSDLHTSTIKNYVSDLHTYAIKNEVSDLHSYTINEFSNLHTYAIKNEVPDIHLEESSKIEYSSLLAQDAINNVSTWLQQMLHHCAPMETDEDAINNDAQKLMWQ